MPISPDLMLAILAMDSYNRGYDAGLTDGGPGDLDGLGESGQIGSATISFTLSDVSQTFADDAEAAGFYAVAYTWNGQTVISYRGTNNLSLFTDPANDIMTGWVNATGTLTDQATLALDFYEAVTGQSVFDDNPPQNVIVTGHSFGGGLAEIVSGLSGVAGYGYDWMPGGLAAMALAQEHYGENYVDLSSFHGTALVNEILQSVRDGDIPDLLSQLPETLLNSLALYLGVFLDPLDPDTHLQDIADSIRLLEGSIAGSQFYDSYSGVGGGVLSAEVADRALKLHMQDYLVQIQFAAEQAQADPNFGTDWQNIGVEFYQAYFNSKVALAAGCPASALMGPNRLN